MATGTEEEAGGTSQHVPQDGVWKPFGLSAGGPEASESGDSWSHYCVGSPTPRTVTVRINPETAPKSVTLSVEPADEARRRQTREANARFRRLTR